MTGPAALTGPGRAAPALHLVRHGQSTWNVEGRLQGQVEHPQLTELGREQAQRAATLLAGARVERLLTSDLRRAVDTAEIIGRAIGLTATPTTLLREQHYGALEGMTSPLAAAEWERLAESAVDDYGYPVPFSERRLAGGESPHDVRARVEALLATPWVTDAEADLVLVTHGDTIRIILSSLLGDEPDEPIWREVGNGEVLSVHRTQDGGVGFTRNRPSGGVGAVKEH